jgi:hypothetical protein
MATALSYPTISGVTTPPYLSALTETANIQNTINFLYYGSADSGTTPRTSLSTTSGIYGMLSQLQTQITGLQTGINVHESAKWATTTTLAAVYAAGNADASNGTGIGATITFSATGVQKIDSATINIALNERILVKNGTTALPGTTSVANGIYYVSTLPAIGVAGILTRALDSDNSVAGEMSEGDFLYVTDGDSNANEAFMLTTSSATGTNPSGGQGAIRIGTDSVTFTQFIGVGSYYIGTTAAQIASANQAVTGILSLAMPGATSGTITLTPSATAGTTAITIPAVAGTLAINPTTTIGDIIYASATGTPGTLARLAGNIAVQPSFLSSTGNASANTTTAFTSSTGSGNVVLVTSPTFATSILGGASMDAFNTTTTTLNIGGAATSLSIGNAATATQTVNMFTASTGGSTYNFATGATGSATTKALNIGTGGGASSTTNITMGSSNGGTFAVNSPAATFSNATSMTLGAASTTITFGTGPTLTTASGTVNLFNTGATALNLGGGTTGTSTSTGLVIGSTATGATSWTNIATAALTGAFTKNVNIGTGGTTGSTTTINIGSATNSTTNILGTLQLAGTSLTTTATKLNYLTSATGTTGTNTTNLVFSTSPTITTPLIDSISTTTGAAATPTLWSDVTTGTVGLANGLTTGTLNIATTAGAKTVSIGSSTGTVTINGTLVAPVGKKVIQTAALSGTSAISFTSIPATYRDLEIRILATTAGATSGTLTLTVNGLVTGIYNTVHQYVNGVSPSAITYAQQSAATSANLTPSTFGATASSSLTYTLNDYTSGSFKNGTIVHMGGPSSGTYFHGTGALFVKSTAAITQIDIAVGGTGGITGSAVLIGVY